MDITALEHAWQEYVRRCGWTGDLKAAPSILQDSRSTWFAGYAAGAGYALSAIKAVAARKDGTPYGLPAAPTGEDS